MGVLKDDDMSVAALKSPWGVGFLLIAGAIAAYAVARTLEDKQR